MNSVEIRAVVHEIERLWRERTPATKVEDLEPENRVTRSEVVSFGLRKGITIPLFDDEYDRAIFKLFDRLRREFPDEPWEPRRNWTAATKQRRKELGV